MLFLIDQLALYRLIGTPEIMAAQLQHLVMVARRPRVTNSNGGNCVETASGSDVILVRE